jgi:hypothetical protein
MDTETTFDYRTFGSYRCKEDYYFTTVDGNTPRFLTVGQRYEIKLMTTGKLCIVDSDRGDIVLTWEQVMQHLSTHADERKDKIANYLTKN